MSSERERERVLSSERERERERERGDGNRESLREREDSFAQKTPIENHPKDTQRRETEREMR